MIQKYVVSKDIEMLAPEWLTSRIDYRTVKILLRDVYGHFEVKGVRIDDEFARIGDIIVFDGRHLSVERRRSNISRPLGYREAISSFYSGMQ